MKKSFCLLVALMLSAPSVWSGESAKIDPDVIYGRKDGMALTFDVLTPAQPNGAGVLWLQSGGWYSGWTEPKFLAKGSAKPYLDKGFTMFIVRHASAPKYTVPEAIDDVRRAVRVIRLKAKGYGVDPDRLGVFGGSAGGHLSLMLGSTGDDGNPQANTLGDKTSSRVAAVVALYPPTDLRGWTTNPPDAIKKIPGLKPPLTFDTKKESACSPILHVTVKMAPTLLIHGDQDQLVPIEHSRNIVKEFEKENVKHKLIEIPGAGHSFTPKQNETIVLPAMLEWFQTHLKAK